jgi:hypothetical protein
MWRAWPFAITATNGHISGCFILGLAAVLAPLLVLFGIWARHQHAHRARAGPREARAQAARQRELHRRMASGHACPSRSGVRDPAHAHLGGDLGAVEPDRPRDPARRVDPMGSCTLSPMRPAPSRIGGRNCASRRTTSHCASGSTWQRGARHWAALPGAARPSAPNSVVFTGWSPTSCSCRTTAGRCGACLRRGTQICARPYPRRLTWLILGSA